MRENRKGGEEEEAAAEEEDLAPEGASTPQSQRRTPFPCL